VRTYLGDGTDLYLEYGFKKLFINKYRLVQDTAILEVYIMTNAASAFGIYSMSIPHCIQWNRYGSFSCTNPYQVKAISGKLFISASNKTGTQTGQALCEQLVKVMIDNNQQDIWYAPSPFQSEKAAPFTNSLHYLKGPVGLMKFLPSWSDMFDDLTYHLFTMSISTPEYKGILARIIFPDELTLSTFIAKSELDIMSESTNPVLTSTGFFLEANSSSANIREFIPVLPDEKWLEDKLSE
jgi:hypothetical protein